MSVNYTLPPCIINGYKTAHFFNQKIYLILQGKYVFFVTRACIQKYELRDMKLIINTLLHFEIELTHTFEECHLQLWNKFNLFSELIVDIFSEMFIIIIIIISL